MNAVVAERGQVIIPKTLRQRMGITPRTVLDFREENGRLIAVKAGSKDRVERVTGCLKLKTTSDELLKKLRGRA